MNSLELTKFFHIPNPPEDAICGFCMADSKDPREKQDDWMGHKVNVGTPSEKLSSCIFHKHCLQNYYKAPECPKNCPMCQRPADLTTILDPEDRRNAEELENKRERNLAREYRHYVATTCALITISQWAGFAFFDLVAHSSGPNYFYTLGGAIAVNNLMLGFLPLFSLFVPAEYREVTMHNTLLFTPAYALLNHMKHATILDLVLTRDPRAYSNLLYDPVIIRTIYTFSLVLLSFLYLPRDYRVIPRTQHAPARTELNWNLKPYVVGMLALVALQALSNTI